jgi:hypothetical protein
MVSIKPENRRLILTCDDNKYYQLEKDDSGRELLANPEIDIITLDEIQDFRGDYEILGGTRILNNMMLVLSPYDDFKYVEISEAKKLIPLEKFQIITHLCQYLGAKSVTIKSVSLKSKKEFRILEFTGRKDFFSGSITPEGESIYELMNNLTIETEFKGGEIQFSEAKKLLNKNNLRSDLFLSSLLEMRDPKISSGNSLKSITHKFSLTETLKETFKFISKLSIPRAYFQIEYESIVAQHTEVSLEININF